MVVSSGYFRGYPQWKEENLAGKVWKFQPWVWAAWECRGRTAAPMNLNAFVWFIMLSISAWIYSIRREWNGPSKMNEWLAAPCKKSDEHNTTLPPKLPGKVDQKTNISDPAE